jgi:beta-glucosidase
MLQTQAFKRGDLPQVEVMRVAPQPFNHDGGDGAIRIAEQSRLRYDDDLLFSLEQGGCYDLVTSVHAHAEPLAQTAGNLLFNDCCVATIQTQGTQGQSIVRKLCRVVLEPGNYRVHFALTKPGLVVEWLELRRIRV